MNPHAQTEEQANSWSNRFSPRTLYSQGQTEGIEGAPLALVVEDDLRVAAERPGEKAVHLIDDLVEHLQPQHIPRRRHRRRSPKLSVAFVAHRCIAIVYTSVADLAAAPPKDSRKKLDTCFRGAVRHRSGDGSRGRPQK